MEAIRPRSFELYQQKEHRGTLGSRQLQFPCALAPPLLDGPALPLWPRPLSATGWVPARLPSCPVQPGHAQCGRSPGSGSAGAERAAGRGAGGSSLGGRAPGPEPPRQGCGVGVGRGKRGFEPLARPSLAAGPEGKGGLAGQSWSVRFWRGLRQGPRPRGPGT